jgi:Spy/CpxP family protein refolding chaperone
MKRLRLTLAALVLALAAAGMAPASADVKSPGQCKKQGPSNCSGQSECHGPHFELLPNGQQKKC